MRLTVRVLGCEVFAVDTTPEPAAAEQSEGTVAHRHSGEFGFGASPAHPYWTAEPGESPAVAALVVDSS